MPYKARDDFPEDIQNVLPVHAEDIYKEAFNGAWEEYKASEDRRGDASREETAHRVAWSAVEQVCEKDAASGRWQRKEG